jgi:hypothetical protein
VVEASQACFGASYKEALSLGLLRPIDPAVVNRQYNLNQISGLSGLISYKGLVYMSATTTVALPTMGELCKAICFGLLQRAF